MDIIHETLAVLGDPGHWVAEVIMDTVYAIPAFLLGRWSLRAHDRKTHGIDK